MKVQLFMIAAFALNLCICFKRKAPTAGVVEKDKKSVDDQSKALGQCSCDVTLNSCDVYCCCDLDCDNDVRKYMSTNYKDYCAKNYLSQIYKPFEQCISKKLIYHKNERMGMKVEPIDDNYCVTLDVGGVFSDKTEELTDGRLKQLQPYDLPYPNMMEIMTQPKILNSEFTFGQSSQYKDSTQILKFAQYAGQTQRAESWFVPQPVGFNGICMNSVGVMFGQDIDNLDCNQYISNLEAASKTFLNSDTFLDFKLWKQYHDTTNDDIKWAGNTNSIALTVKNQWVLDQETNKLTKLAEGAAKPAISYSSCKASNVVKSVFYTIEYELAWDQRLGKVQKRITEVGADIVFQNQLELDSKYCGDKTKPLGGGKADQIVYNQALQDGSVATEGAKFTQTFGVKFLSKKVSVDQARDAKINGEVNYKSGNPGYNTNMNLIVGESAPDGFKKDSDPQKVNKDGFYLFSHDKLGNCYANTDDSVFDYPTKRLRFGEIAQLTCAIQMTAAELEAMCNDATNEKFKSLEIFKQIDDKLNWISKFGNPNIAYTKDWIKIDKPADLAAKKWEDAAKPKKTCTGGIGYDVKILTSKLGFEDKLQTYVVGAEVKEIIEDWTYARTDAAAQDFLHVLSISFHEVVSDQLYAASQSEAINILPKLPKDLFYPFELQT